MSWWSMPRTWWEISVQESISSSKNIQNWRKKGTFVPGTNGMLLMMVQNMRKHICTLFFPADSLEFCNWLIWCVSMWWIILGEILFTLKCIAGNYFTRACSSDEIYLQVRPVHMDGPVRDVCICLLSGQRIATIYQPVAGGETVYERARESARG
jgi:hypothetical protein